MPRPRFTIPAMMLAVSLLAAGCGGGQQDASEEPDDAQADGVSEVATSDGDDRPETTERETTGQPDAAPDPEPEPEPQPVLVRLGDRFGWCADIQRTWDWLAEIQGQVDAVEAARLDAQAALEAATDELDRAEALQALESAEESYLDFVPAFRDAMDEVTRLLEPDWRSNSGETEAIAVERAREAFYAAAAPTLVDLMKVAQAGRPTRVELQQPEREPVDQTLPPEELLAALEALQDEADGLVQESIGVKLAMKGAFLDIQVAPTPKDAMDAYALFVEGYQGLHELNQASYLGRETGREISRALVSVGLDGAGAHEALQEARYSIGYIHPWPYDPNPDRNPDVPESFSDVAWAVHETLMQATNEFVLADPAWGAFQMSLSESCQP